MEGPVLQMFVLNELYDLRSEGVHLLTQASYID